MRETTAPTATVRPNYAGAFYELANEDSAVERDEAEDSTPPRESLATRLVRELVRSFRLEAGVHG